MMLIVLTLLPSRRRTTRLSRRCRFLIAEPARRRVSLSCVRWSRLVLCSRGNAVRIPSNNPSHPSRLTIGPYA